MDVFARVRRGATLGLRVYDGKGRRDFGGGDLNAVLVEVVFVGRYRRGAGANVRDLDMCCTICQLAATKPSNEQYRRAYPMDGGYGKELSHPACPGGRVDVIALWEC